MSFSGALVENGDDLVKSLKLMNFSVRNLDVLGLFTEHDFCELQLLLYSNKNRDFLTVQLCSENRSLEERLKA